jgi:hypothetical protein
LVRGVQELQEVRGGQEDQEEHKVKEAMAEGRV